MRPASDGISRPCSAGIWAARGLSRQRLHDPGTRPGPRDHAALLRRVPGLSWPVEPSLRPRDHGRLQRGWTELQRFVNAAHSEEIVFTKNATEGINLVAHCWPWQEGDQVLCSDLEHNSNLLPWTRLRQSRKLKVEVLATDIDTGFDLERFREALAGPVKLVAVPQVSNLSGVASVREICALAHAREPGWWSTARRPCAACSLDVRGLDADFYSSRRIR